MQTEKRYPDPLMKREKAVCLDGEWDFFTDGKAYKIKVPYCPESEASGLKLGNGVEKCVYRLKFALPAELQGEERILVRFGAVCHRAEVYLNGVRLGGHSGGYTPFALETGGALKRDGENELEVRVENDPKANVPSGKQTSKGHSYGCFYTRTTGIWQSVWLESVPESRIDYVRFYPDAAHGKVTVEVGVTGQGCVDGKIFYEGKEMGGFSAETSHRAKAEIALAEKHLWELGKGRLYDVRLKFGKDEVRTYFGLRDVRYDGYKFLLNGKSVFQRLVLDQGYYPDGIYTPGDRSAFEKDIRLSMEYGFNGARLHQKVFDPEFLYLCDKLGYMVWGEYPSWGMEYYDLDGLGTFVGEWREAVERDFNHPSIVTWCPLNEVWNDLDKTEKTRDARFVESVYAVTKLLDPTRPCVDVSGGCHGRYTDVADFHCYDKYDELKEKMQAAEAGNPDFYMMYQPGEDVGYKGGPLNLSEFGGIRLGKEEEGAWGYNTLGDEESFVSDYEKKAEFLLSCEKLSGYCYTQLYDVEQEENGLVMYERKAKLSEEGIRRIREANAAPAAIEGED